MTSRDFCFWLQGFFEIGPGNNKVQLTYEQSETIRRHLALVFKHEIDPSMPGKELDAIHSGTIETQKINEKMQQANIDAKKAVRC